MAQILVGDPNDYDSVIYGRSHPGTLAFIQAQAQNIVHNMTDAGKQFLETRSMVYDWINDSEAARLARAIGRKVQSIWQNDDIRALVKMGEFQHAMSQMQRWIMAEPMCRQMYLDDKLDGYSRSYVNVHGNGVGKDHYDYRRVMDGIVEECPEGGWEATNFVEELLPNDRDLYFDEQVDIAYTWHGLRKHLKNKGEDPTSVFNSDL